MADNSAVKVTHGSVGTTAETSWLTQQWNVFRITNKHATLRLGVRAFTGATAAAAKAKADATDAVIGADEVHDIAPGGEDVVLRSSSPVFAAFSVIADGAGPATYELVGDTFQEGD